MQTTPDITAPSVPTGVAKATGSMNSLRWDASTDDVGVTGYLIYKNGALAKTVTTLADGVPRSRKHFSSIGSGRVVGRGLPTTG
jgi:hypothetical protein